MLKSLPLLNDGMQSMVVRFKNRVIKRNVDDRCRSNRRVCGFSVDEEIRSTGSNPSGSPGVVDLMYQQTSICRNCSSKGFCQEHCNYPFLHTRVSTLSGERVCPPDIGDGSPSDFVLE